MVIGYELWLTYKYMIRPSQVKNPGYAPGLEVLKSCFSKIVVFSKSAKPPKKSKDFQPVFAKKKPFQFSGIVGWDGFKLHLV